MFNAYRQPAIAASKMLLSVVAEFKADDAS
jgi:hypothetical protein